MKHSQRARTKYLFRVYRQSCAREVTLFLYGVAASEIGKWGMPGKPLPDPFKFLPAIIRRYRNGSMQERG
jgi:hypothetical protein